MKSQTLIKAPGFWVCSIGVAISFLAVVMVLVYLVAVNENLVKD
jgi:hypothetical protein